MTRMQDENDQSGEDCEHAVDRLLGRYEWTLLQRDEFVRRTRNRLCEEGTADASRAAKFVYSEALYAACSGLEGATRREQGFAELHRWLYDVAHHRYGELADDATQQALLATHASFDRCRQPGTFVMYALIQLRDAARSLKRQAAAESLMNEWTTPTSTPRAELIPDQAPLPEALVLHADLRARLDQLTAAFLRKHPRAAAQFAAVWYKFILGLDDNEISRRLGKPVDHVYVLRTRGLRKLQREPQWRALAADLGLDVGEG